MCSEALPSRVRKSGKVGEYDRVGRSLLRKSPGKVIRPSKRSGKAGLT
jgi:hypothetical protein